MIGYITDGRAMETLGGSREKADGLPDGMALETMAVMACVCWCAPPCTQTEGGMFSREGLSQNGHGSTTYTQMFTYRMQKEQCNLFLTPLLSLPPHPRFQCWKCFHGWQRKPK